MPTLARLIAIATFSAALFASISCSSTAKRNDERCDPTPPVTAEEKAAGGLDRDHIACVINRDAMGPARECYEKTFTLPGYKPEPVRVTTNFEIGSEGNVTKAVSESETATESLKLCVTNAMKSLKYARPYGDKPVKVSYPFLFRRTSAGPESIFDT